MSHQHCNSNCNHTLSTLYTQSLTELDFERSIHGCAQRGDVAKVRKWLLKCCPDERDRAGYTALHYAARQGHVDVCRVILESGGDPNAKTHEIGATPLHKAILSRNFPTVDLLLSYDALADMADNDGRTPWHVAACVGDVNILRRMLQISRGVAMVKDKHGRLPVDLAKSEEIVVILQ
ncbi:uncharacterized protein SPPG_09064 [Spizellomyces punctatus DAOM BR117]|uniref:Ankyrin repeat protein n=1 Tax=Spizellomyces punctatus (strain DAOM BR117) TaxID=645134 RepID=A0A0L0HN81_SPIPD|nr:uncharacterized protein SPPG_09064 [Spizellomyces punctatus DAOM BR117]KND02395.1 hypothetical protein SPPG_09064 [Spizellomyces punctatus DAOM BR117]|eukprot:XP_016610434.1 hypothetical protein SPPG_09064 [Spizellomyces punctatus DAOM BR117]